MYQVVDWVDNFESAKSKQWKSLSHVYVPNKQTGDGFIFIQSQSDSLAILGAWYLLIEALSLQKERQGYCTDTGKASGKPWTATSLALRWRCKAEQVQRMLDICSSEDVGWIKIIETASAQYPHGIPDQLPICKDLPPELELKLKPILEHKQLTACGETQTDASAPPSTADSVLTFPCDGKVPQWHLTQTCLDDWKTIYPSLDVLQEARSALAWIVANPGRRKTARGMSSFLVNWFNRSQNRGLHAVNRGSIATAQRPGFHSGKQAQDIAAMEQRAITFHADGTISGPN